MKIEMLNKSFHIAYQTLLDTVEERVVNDGESLQQALVYAEEKLNEWGVLNMEEVQEICIELKQDLGNLSEHLNEANESFKKESKQHSPFVTDPTWDQSWNIINTNTILLSSISKNSKKQAQEINKDENLTNQQEHTQRNSDYDLWLTEIALWKIQYAKSFDKLDEIEKVIKQHSNMLDEHAAVTHALDVRGHAHEKVISIAKQHPSIHVIEELEDKENFMRKQKRQEHIKHAELHNSMKKYHSEMMSLIDKLYKKVIKEVF